MDFQKEFNTLRKDFIDSLEKITDAEELQKFRDQMLGRKGALATLMKEVKNVAEDERPRVGKLANEVKAELQEQFENVSNRLLHRNKHDTVELDATLPGEKVHSGHLHPLTIVRNDIERIFHTMGFKVYDGDELVTDYDNFGSLNFAENHPARDIQDTFFIKPGKNTKPTHLLRAHTSAMQVRIMKENTGALRSVVIGRVFRNEATDAKHEHTFYQVEGLVVDERITIGHLKYTLRELYSRILEKDIQVRLRPSFFPFVEPGFETDIRIPGYKIGKSEWLEIGGCGMVHPNVLKAGGYDPKKYTGFAFGVGIDRLTMMRYGIEDIRHFHSGDLRFLEQF